MLLLESAINAKESWFAVKTCVTKKKIKISKLTFFEWIDLIEAKVVEESNNKIEYNYKEIKMKISYMQTEKLLLKNEVYLKLNILIQT